MFKNKIKEKDSVKCEVTCYTSCTFKVGLYTITIQEGDMTCCTIRSRSMYSPEYLYFSNKEELITLCKGILSKLGELNKYDL